MPSLRAMEPRLTVDWLGVVADRKATLRSAPREALELGFGGAGGESHGGPTRPSCSRVKTQYPVGTEIRNARQISALSAEELADVAAEMGIPEIRPEWTGANLILSGMEAFSLIPPSARIIFDSGASIVVDMANGPCRFVAEEIEAEHPGRGMAFPRIATNRRGIVGWVERPGRIEIGMTAALHIPTQPRHPAYG